MSLYPFAFIDLHWRQVPWMQLR